MLKKIFIGSTIFFIIAIGVALYFILFNKSTTSSSLKTVPANNQLPLSSVNGVITRPRQGQSAGSTKIIVDGNGNKEVVLNPLMELSSDPVAGAVLFQKGTTTLARYVEKGTGHISEVNLNTGTTSVISNTTTPLITEAVWLPDGNTTIFRYPDQTGTSIVSYSVAISKPKGATSFQTVGTYLPTGIDSIVVNPTGTKIFYLIPTSSGEKGVIANPDGTKAAILFTSSFEEWLSSWPSATTLALTTKPSVQVPGYTYLVNTSSGVMKKIISGVNGLTALVSPDLKSDVYSDNTNQLYTNSVGSIDRIPLSQTLADKCVWSKKQSNTIYCALPSSIPYGVYPDSWYQGQVSFSDSLYKIDTITGTNTVIANLPGNYSVDIDATNLYLSPDENYLLFTDKGDSSLWSFNVGSVK